jgi:zinc protease
VLGEFVPIERPDRAEIPPTPSLEAALEGYKGGETVRLGEAFDPSPQNIESRVSRRSLSNGITAALLPKQTRGGRAVATLTLHWGDEKSLMNRETACNFAGAMLARGTKKRSRAQLKEAFERLNASVSISGGGATIEARGENLIPALELVAEALREPAFSREEFEEMKRAAITGAEAQKTDPSSLARVRLARHLQDYPTGHLHYTPTIDERVEWMRSATLEDAVACYRELYGATGAEFAAVGDFKPDAVAAALDSLFGPWVTPSPYRRVPYRHAERAPTVQDLLTPDKANAVLLAGLDLRVRDDHADFPALTLVNYLLGASSTARLPARVREKEGLSYSTYTTFTSSAFDESAAFRVASIFAPQNRARVESAIREELARAVKEGFGAAEVEAGKKSLLEQRRLARTQDRGLAFRLGSYLHYKRTFAWDVDFERKIAALTPRQVNAALRRHIDPAKLSVVVAGDLKK